MGTPTPPPMEVTVIRGTGDGHPLVSGTVAATPTTAQPDLLIRVVSPLVAVLIRFFNTYLTVLVGLVTAGMTSDVIPAPDFWALVLKCAGLSVAGAAVGAVKDVITIVGRLETKFPLLTGSV